MSTLEVVKENAIVFHNNDDVFMIEVVFPCGAINENDENHGISHFLEHMKFRRIKDKNEKDTNNILAVSGATVNAYTTKDQTCYFIKCNLAEMGDAIDAMVALVFDTDFKNNRIAVERKIILEELKMRQASEGYYHDILSTVLESSSLYYNSIGGTRATIKKITNAELKRYNDYFYCLKNAQFVLSCPKTKTKRMFARLVTSIDAYRVRVEPPTERKYNTQMDMCDFRRFEPSVVVQRVRANQNTVSLSFGHFGRTHKDHLLVNFIIFILTGSYNSLLKKYIREDKGYTYNVQAVNTSYMHFGILSVNFSTSNDNVCEVIHEIFEVIQKYLFNDKLNPSMFLKFKKDYLKSLEFRMKNEDNLMDFYSGMCNLDSKTTLRAFMRRVDALTQAELRVICSSIFRFDRLGCMIYTKGLSQDAHVDAFKSILLKFKNQ